MSVRAIRVFPVRPLGLLALAAAAACALGGAEALAAGTPRCHTGDVRASLRNPDAGVGNGGADLVLTNRSGHACSITGYPGLGLLDASRRAQPARVLRGGTYFAQDPGPRAVLLRPGRSAYASLGWSGVAGAGESQTGQCEPTSAYLKATPPGEAAYLAVKFGQAVCSHGMIRATAFAAGTGPRP